MRSEQLRRREKSGRRIAFDHDGQRAEHLAVVVVVPRRYAEDHAFARIADTRTAGVGDQRDLLPTTQPFDDFFAPPGFIELEITEQRLGDPEMFQ